MWKTIIFQAPHTIKMLQVRTAHSLLWRFFIRPYCPLENIQLNFFWNKASSLHLIAYSPNSLYSVIFLTVHSNFTTKSLHCLWTLASFLNQAEIYILTFLVVFLGWKKKYGWMRSSQQIHQTKCSTENKHAKFFYSSSLVMLTVLI